MLLPVFGAVQFDMEYGRPPTELPERSTPCAGFLHLFRVGFWFFSLVAEVWKDRACVFVEFGIN